MAVSEAIDSVDHGAEGARRSGARLADAGPSEKTTVRVHRPVGGCRLAQINRIAKGLGKAIEEIEPGLRRRQVEGANSFEGGDVGKNVTNVLAAQSQVGHRWMWVDDKSDENIGILWQPLRNSREWRHVG
jgi:hypothetical protein